MGNSDHGTTYMEVGGDDGEVRGTSYTYTMALHIHIQHRG